MPYIDQNARLSFDDTIRSLTPQTPGELNYVITKLMLEYGKRKQEKPSYSLYNELVGVVECLKMEFYRRAVSVYENEKISEHGDVYSRGTKFNRYKRTE